MDHHRFRRFSSLVASVAVATALAHPALGADLPSREAIKACLIGLNGPECLDKLFREALKSYSTGEALALIQRLEAEDGDLRRDCRLVVHAIGRETFRLDVNIHESFAACDQSCHSGCYHGSVERFLRGEEIYA